MRVDLIDFTGKGSPDPSRHAANVLVFTKQTRLKMEPDLMSDVESWSQEKISSELEYMANTIPSSWEFVTYTFLVNGVTRAFTHQFVRTRTGSFSQQTMRVLDADGWGYHTGPTIACDPEIQKAYDVGMQEIDYRYRRMIDQGAKIEDARGILPTNILTNIVAKFDLRTFADTQRKRASTRTQGEYRDVMAAMRDEVIRVHPWAVMFLDRTFDKAAAELEQGIIQISLNDDWPEQNRVDLIKLIDQMRMTA